MSNNNLTVPEIDKKFGLKQLKKIDSLESLLHYSDKKENSISDFEKQMIAYLQDNLILGYLYWNEYELREKFIGPLITLAQFETDDFNYFAERSVNASVNNEPMSR